MASVIILATTVYLHLICRDLNEFQPPYCSYISPIIILSPISLIPAMYLPFVDYIWLCYKSHEEMMSKKTCCFIIWPNYTAFLMAERTQWCLIMPRRVQFQASRWWLEYSPAVFFVRPVWSRLCQSKYNHSLANSFPGNLTWQPFMNGLIQFAKSLSSCDIY